MTNAKTTQVIPHSQNQHLTEKGPFGNTCIDSTHTPINFTSQCSSTNVLIRPYTLMSATT